MLPFIHLQLSGHQTLKKGKLATPVPLLAQRPPNFAFPDPGEEGQRTPNNPEISNNHPIPLPHDYRRRLTHTCSSSYLRTHTRCATDLLPHTSGQVAIHTRWGTPPSTTRLSCSTTVQAPSARASQARISPNVFSRLLSGGRSTCACWRAR